jgi:LCP family protein required for cell wall assembly
MFCEWGKFPAWALMTVLTREFAVTGLRLVAVQKGNVIAAGWSGKVKTASTMVGLCVMMALPEVQIINILVVGQSSRAGEESRMADTTMLVSVNTFDGSITVYSVLRDSYVKLPDYKGHVCGRAKFTVCYGLGYQWGGIAGAMEMTNICMRDNFGVEVDYNVEIDFESFTRVVDLLGGIEIELTEAEAKYLNNDDLYVRYDVQAGKQYLDGMAALSYARMRKAEGDADSDIKRSARQRLVLEKLFEKVRGLSLAELQSVADTLLPEITTTMTPGDVVSIMTKTLPVLKKVKIVGATIPYEKTGWGEIIDIYEDGIPDSVIKFEAPQQKRLIRAITEAETN